VRTGGVVESQACGGWHGRREGSETARDLAKPNVRYSARLRTRDSRQMRMFDVSHRCALGADYAVSLRWVHGCRYRREGKSGWRLTSFKIGVALIAVGLAGGVGLWILR
jgi:hypothetical protein